jgi:asparagine synthase (glutamine-hydrolysing)
MCGIAGFLSPRTGASPESMGSVIRAMMDCLRHRGPDDEGSWLDPDAGIVLGHRRLSIVDLSPAGHQPMTSADGRLVITFNGEIYNFRELRAELEASGVQFRGHSDTEVMLESFARYGIAAMLPRLIGMFSMALWDRRERTLSLVRDRLGIKPLYWRYDGGLFIFGSELKALRAHPSWTPEIDRGAVAAFLRHNYVPAPHSIYRGVHKLKPGCMLTLAWQKGPQIARYWDAREVARSAQPLALPENELIEQLETLLTDAVGRRMIADVPVGAFLSGGVDSSTVVALMKAANAGPVKTFTVGFDIPGFDEAPHAKAVARHLGTEHTELTCSAQEALDVVPRLPEWYDEPFADSSQIPTYLISALTRRHVTVALSGDGGDELFGGYNRYLLTQRSWRALSGLPQPIRAAVSRALMAVKPEQWSSIAGLLPSRMRPTHAGDKLHKLASVLPMNDFGALYNRLVSHCEPDELLMAATPEPKGLSWDASLGHDFPEPLSRMRFFDLATYLPDDILTKVDRASMAVGLEARVPLLDHRVVEFAWRLRPNVLIRNASTKWILRQILYKHVPREIVERPKMGFGVPLAAWLRGPLRDWAESLLDERRLTTGAFLNPRAIRALWHEHLTGRRNSAYLLWNVLMLEAWREQWAHFSTQSATRGRINNRAVTSTFAY